ncbi:MAG: tripartite tricarboxylate transporter substrate binding protein [Betaproteobacteria bacterium]
MWRTKSYFLDFQKLCFFGFFYLLTWGCFAAGNSASVNDFPNKPVRWIVPTAPGAGTDFTARKFSQIASDVWQQSVIVDNRSGASGMIGLDLIAQAPADGYTLGFISVSQFIDGLLQQKFSFESTKDFTPISILASTPLVLVVNATSGLNSLPSLLAFAKARPGEISYSSGGSGGLTHLAMEVFLNKSGIQATHIPYKGSGPALVDLLASRVQMTFSTPPAVLQHIKTNRLKPLAMATASRSALMPDVPTFGEQGVQGVIVGTWYGLIGPANMPPELAEKIARNIAQAVKGNAVKENMQSQGIETQASTPGEFTRLLNSEKNQWSEVVKTIGFKREQ